MLYNNAMLCSNRLHLLIDTVLRLAFNSRTVLGKKLLWYADVLPQFTSVEVELPQQLKSIGKPLVLAIFGSELAILTAFCCFIFICRFLHASHE